MDAARLGSLVTAALVLSAPRLSAPRDERKARLIEEERRALWDRARAVADIREIAGQWTCAGDDVPAASPWRRWDLTLPEQGWGLELLEDADGGTAFPMAKYRVRRSRLQAWTRAWIFWETIGAVRSSDGAMLLEREGQVYVFRSKP